MNNVTNNPLLTILITTYNRSIALDAVLNMLASYQEKGLLFNVLVSDDCSTDNTQEIGKKWTSKIKGFSFIQTKQNMGMDNNFQNVYNNFHTDYCWLLGDTRYISFESLSTILDILSTSQYDALILRCRNEMPHERIIYNEINNLMSQQGWHITNNASCIIPKHFINKYLYHRYFGTTFLHMGIFVENLCMQKHWSVLYLGDVNITEMNIENFNKVGWTKHPFLNFGKFWYEFIMSLPNQINIDIKHKVLKDHDRYTHIFSISDVHRQIVMYRKTYVNSYLENRKYMPYVIDKPLWIYDLLIRITPINFYMTLFNIYQFLKKLRCSNK